MAYTPGPWKLFKDTGNDVYQITDGHGAVVIADFVNKDNADLIVAAPDLLEACTLLSQPFTVREASPRESYVAGWRDGVKAGRRAMEDLEPKERED